MYPIERANIGIPAGTHVTTHVPYIFTGCVHNVRLIIKGYKKELLEGDLWNLNPRDSTRINYKRFSEEWDKELKRKIKDTRRFRGLYTMIYIICCAK